MALVVQKYGGSSVSDVDAMRRVARRIVATRQAGNTVVVVVSAMGDTTDELLDQAAALTTDAPAREMDILLSAGERISVALLAMAVSELGVPARAYTGAQAGVLTDSKYGKASIVGVLPERVARSIQTGSVAIVAGFQGINEVEDTTTLGRGGSDTSAVALAAALKADECQIYTDVDGVYTTDPRVVPEARRMNTVSFEEMLELASLGSKVLQIRSVEFAGKYKVRLRVLSSLTDGGEGTLITYEEDPNMEKAIVSGIAFDKNQARINVRGVPDKPGIAYQILGAVADANIDVDMIIQNAGEEGTTDFSFTVSRGDYRHTIDLLQSVQESIGAADIHGDDTVCKVSIVGIGMRSHIDVASTMFRTLAEENINIQLISTSEIKISVLIDEKYLELATRVLHKAFGLDRQQ